MHEEYINIYKRMKLSLKYPVANANPYNAEEQIFNSTKSTQQVENTKTATILGSLTFLAYLSVFVSVYGSSRWNGDISFIPQIINKSVKGFTMSEAFEHCHKESSTIFIILFLALLQALYTEQNFSYEDPKRIAVIAMNYLVLIGWLSLYFVLRDQKSHYFVAILVLICTLVNTLMVTELYNENYDKSELDMINYPCYILIAIYLTLCLIFILSGIYYFSYKSTTQISRLITGTIGIFEITSIILFGIFIVIFSQLPPLPNNQNLVCSYT
jgi:hypothetical protein